LAVAVSEFDCYMKFRVLKVDSVQMKKFCENSGFEEQGVCVFAGSLFSGCLVPENF